MVGVSERVSFKEDAEIRASSLVKSVEKGLGAWGKNVQEREGPDERFLEAHGGKLQ